MRIQALPCSFLCDGSVLTQSGRGVNQGDTLGPIGFSLGTDRALDAVAHLSAGLDWQAWYLDDGFMVGRPETVAAYFRALVPALAECGLTVNMAKCLSWGTRLESDLGPATWSDRLGS